MFLEATIRSRFIEDERHYERPLIRIKCCRHTRQKKQKTHFSGLPVELVFRVRDFIFDLPTLTAFDTAFGIPSCVKTVCRRYAEEMYYDQHLDTLSLVEVEMNKRNYVLNDRYQTYLTLPTHYKIERTSNGFSLMVIKETSMPQYHHLRDPVHHANHWIPVNLFHAYDPDFMAHGLEIPAYYYKHDQFTLGKEYNAIRRWFNQPEPKKYMYTNYESISQQRWLKKRGALWIYPETESSILFHLPNARWVQTLYDMAIFQRTYSPVLQQCHSNVSETCDYFRRIRPNI